MWLSRKISSILKQKSLLHSSSTTFINSFHKRKEEHVSFVLAVTSGVNNTGKSTLIKCLGLQELKYDIHHHHHHNSSNSSNSMYIYNNNAAHNNYYTHTCYAAALGKLYRLKNNEQFIIQIIEYNGIPPNLDILDGVFICYDITNRDSMDYLPDIINVFVSQHVPCLLIGLKSDLTVLRTVDPQLGHLIGNLFGVQAIEADNFTINGVQLLQKRFIQFIYSDRKVLLYHQQQGQDHPTTAADDTCSLAINDNAPSSIKVNNHKNNNNKLCTNNSTTTIMSRSSSASTATTNGTTGGKTIPNIVDEVLNNHHDENIVIIFLTVFRKFMKPSDLVNILIQRFESDLTPNNNQEPVVSAINSDSETDMVKLVLPTARQERIRSFFCLWLSQYWGDFKSSATRRTILQFLERISAYEPLTSICDVLLLLAIREPAICDKDSYWGMCDDEEEPVIQQPKQQQQRKKDSGYCESFGDWIGHDLNHHHEKHSMIKKKPTLKSTTTKLLSTSLRRASSTNSHQRIPVTFKSIVSLTPPVSDSRRNSTPTTHNNNNNNRNSTSSTHSTFGLAVFGGGMISVIEQQFIMVDPFEIMTSISACKFAEQLTWIEAELFRKIQPRDFLRHLWTQRKKRRRSHNPNQNPVLASIEHFNFIAGWIASLVVNQPVLEKRVIVFEYCLQIAVELKSLNNFNTLMAVLAGVNSAAVLRLKHTRQSTKLRNKKLYDQFIELESLMSSERSFYNYRTTLRQTELPGIPYLGIHQQDLVSLGEANKDHKTDGKVHWKKFRLMGESILEMVRFQYPTYHLLEPNPFLLYFIGHESIPTEDERYEKSKEIEPRSLKPSLSTSSSSTSSRWLTSLK